MSRVLFMCVVASARRSRQETDQLEAGPFDFGGGFGGGGFGGGGFDDMPGLGGGGFPGGNGGMPDQGGDFGMPGFDQGGFNMPKPKPQKTESDNTGGGMFPGFDMNGMADMMNGMMGDAMNCMQKEHDICCNDANYRKTVCLPLWYCMIGMGERDFGPMPPCDAPIQFGDASKCKKDDQTMRSDLRTAKSMCFSKIQELYDLQAKLGQCMADLGTEKKKVEDERQGLTDLQHEAEECETKKAEEKAKKSLGEGSGGSVGSAEFCPAEAEAIRAAMTTYTEAVGKCVSLQVSATVRIPEINIKVPEIKVGVVTGGSFNLEVPDFSAPDFTGDIVVPGGGGKLNVAVEGGQGGQGGQGGHTSEAKLTFEQREANIKADIKECEEAKPKMAQKKQELAASKGEVQKQKQKACEESSLLEVSATPEAQVAIQVFSMMKMVWTCSDVQGAIDALIAILQRC